MKAGPTAMGTESGGRAEKERDVMESGADKPVDQIPDEGAGATRLEPHSPTARTPFGPGNQPAAETDTALPKSLQGRYQLLRVLGKGGFATVYLANDNVLDQQVAIKILKLGMTNKADQERFLREARIGARLRHNHIAQVFDIILAPDGLQMIMEFCPGGTLADLIKAKGALKPQRAIQIARQVGQALAHAHQHQFIHRDVKPANVFFMNDGSVKLGDFGIAASVTSHEFTQTGMIIGTPIYMAPEQSSDSRDVDPRADLYSLGLTLYVMLTGHSPRVIDLDLVPPAFRSLIKHATYPDRNQRMVSAEQFCAMLDKIERELKMESVTQGKSRGRTAEDQNTGAEAVTGQTSEKVRTGQKAEPAGHPRRAIEMAVAVAAIVVLLAVIAAMMLKGGPKESAQQPAPPPPKPTVAATLQPTVRPTPTQAPARTAAAVKPVPTKQVPQIVPTATPTPVPTPLPPRSMAEGIQKLLGENRELNTALENFKSYEKLAPITRQLTITNSYGAIRNALDQAEKSRQSDLPLLHVVAAYAMYREGKIEEARRQIEEARRANRHMNWQYDLDNRKELGELFGLSGDAINQLYTTPR